MSKGHGTKTLRYALEKGTGAVCFLLGSVGDNTEHNMEIQESKQRVLNTSLKDLDLL